MTATGAHRRHIICPKCGAHLNLNADSTAPTFKCKTCGEVSPKPTGMPPAGWYVDPDDKYGQRWWDGAAWTDQRVGPRPTGKRAVWVTMAIVGSLAVFASCVYALSSASGGPQDAIRACKEEARRQLKDPDSAQFSGWKAGLITPKHTSGGLAYNPDAGDKWYAVTGMVNAKNGFGGYTGSHAWACDAVVSKNGDTQASAHDISGLINDFNAPG